MKLIVPGKTTVSAIQLAGPFTVLLGRSTQLPAHHVHVENPSSSPCRIRCLLAPLRDQNGNDLPTQFQARIKNQSTKDYVSIAPRSSCAIQLMPITPFVLSPGEYASRLDIEIEDSTDTQSIPITLRVRAHLAWALVFLFLGLVSIGCITLIAGEGKVNKQISEVLALQESTHELAEKYTTDSVVIGLTADIDNALQQALTALNHPRSSGFFDWRMDQANRSMQIAQQTIKQLRSRIENGTPGEIAVKKLRDRWKKTNTKIQSMEQHSGKAIPENKKPIASVWLDNFLDRTGRDNTEPLILVIKEWLSPHMERTEWTLFAGEDDRAARMAVKVQFWLERTASRLRQALDVQMVWKINGQNMLRLFHTLQHAVDEQIFTPEQRVKLSTMLEPARQVFAGEPTLTGMEDAHAAIQAAATQAFQFNSDQVLEEIRAVSKKTDQRAGIEPIADFMSTLSPDNPPGKKQQNLLTIVRLWRKWLASQPESEGLNEIRISIERLGEHTQNNERALLAATMEELVGLWQTYHRQEIEAAQSKKLRSYCRNVKANLMAELAVARESHRLLEPHPAVAGLDKTLDSLERQFRQTQLDHSCLTSLTELGSQSLQVGDTLFQTLLQVSNISDRARLDSAEHSTDQRAIVLARQLMTEPWPIHLTTLTLPAEQHAGREITFQIDNLKPSWKQDIQLTLDFDDGALKTNHAELLRKRGLLTHRYDQPGLYSIKIKALSKNSVTGETTIIGNARLKLLVNQSPVSQAERIAGTFFNLRFLLALGIALLIGTWRFAGNPLFGADKKAYLEAFVVGFSTNLGIEGLASWTAGIIL